MKKPAGPGSGDDLRRGILVDGLPVSGNARRLARARFGEQLRDYVEEGGRCDLLSADHLPNSPLGGFGASLIRSAMRGEAERPETTDALDCGGLDVPHNPTDSGYCYLSLVRSDAWGRAETDLGSNPFGAAVGSWCLENAPLLSGKRHRLSLCSTNRRPHVQAHIEEDPDGLTWQQVCQAMVFGCRLGATNVPVAAPTVANPDVRPSRMEVPTPPGITINVPFAFAVDQDSGGFTFSPRHHPGVVRITQYFESAKLLHLGMEIHISGSPDAICRISATSGGMPYGNFGWLSGPYTALATGNAQGGTTTLFEIPRGHSFGKEIKAPPLGNQDPDVHFLCTASATTFFFAKGNLVLELSGTGNAGAFNVGPRKIANAPVALSPEVPRSPRGKQRAVTQRPRSPVHTRAELAQQLRPTPSVDTTLVEGTSEEETE